MAQTKTKKKTLFKIYEMPDNSQCKNKDGIMYHAYGSLVDKALKKGIITENETFSCDLKDFVILLDKIIQV